jgi:hypothetical protein
VLTGLDTAKAALTGSPPRIESEKAARASSKYARQTAARTIARESVRPLNLSGAKALTLAHGGGTRVRRSNRQTCSASVGTGWCETVLIGRAFVVAPVGGAGKDENTLSFDACTDRTRFPRSGNVRASFSPSIDATAAASYGLPVDAT